MLRCLPALTLALVAIAGATFAERAPSSSELKSLEKDLRSYTRAMERNRARVLIDALPERVLPTTAAQAQAPVRLIRKTLIDQAQAFGRASKPEEVAVDLSGLKVDDAGGLTWGPVTITGTSLVSGQRIRFATEMVAILEGGDWHFARIDMEAQADLIRAAYPEITELTPGR